MVAVLGVNVSVQGDYEPSPASWVRDQVEAYEASGGTQGTTLGDTGLPVVVVTNLGAKSGKVRKTPLMRVEHQGCYAAVGSKGGAPQDPLWVNNVRASPRVELQDGPLKQDMIAREVTGEERAAWWALAVAAYPPYADYQKKTDRLIPVFVLEPTE
jgi:deazaflavin-dependent oxidoreductase (nitroreductase family)